MKRKEKEEEATKDLLSWQDYDSVRRFLRIYSSDILLRTTEGMPTDEGKQMISAIQELESSIKTAKGRGDWKLFNKLLRTELRFLELMLPHIKGKKNKKQDYSNLVQALEGLPDPVVEQMLVALEKEHEAL